MSYADDIAAIGQVLTHYCQRSDAGDAHAVTALFSEDGVLEVGPETAAVGQAAVLAWYRNRLAELLRPAAQMRHKVTSAAIDIDGDTASALAFFDAEILFKTDGELFGAPASPGDLLRASGAYDYDLSRDGDSWKIRRLRINPSWVERGTVEAEFLGARAAART